MSGSVVLLSSVNWHFTWQRHHNLAAGFARRGRAVLFVEPLPKRWPRPSELSRVAGRIAGRLERAGLCRQRVPAGVTLFNTRLPPDGGPVSRTLNRKLFVPRIARRIERLGLPEPRVVWCTLPTPSAIELLRALRPATSVYDCAWDWSSDPYSSGLERHEAELLDLVDHVLADSPHNRERLAPRRPDAIELPHGVDVDLFAAAAGGRRNPSSPIRCAYFGDLGTSIDVDLLAQVSQRHELTVIGTVRVDVGGFAAATRFVGPLPREELPGHLRDADVLLLPYRLAPDTRGILPAKVFECLATGKPTVATALPSLGPLAEWIELCPDRQTFLNRVASAAAEEPARCAGRRTFARRHTWDARLDRIDELLA